MCGITEINDVEHFLNATKIDVDGQGKSTKMVSPGSAGIEVARLEHRPHPASGLVETGVASAKHEGIPGCRPYESEQKPQRC